MQSGSMMFPLALVAVAASLFVTGANGQGGYLPPSPPVDCNQPYWCTAEGMFTNPNNCNSFYWCVDDTGRGDFRMYEFNCGMGLWFDERQRICNWILQVSPVPRCAAC